LLHAALFLGGVCQSFDLVGDIHASLFLKIEEPRGEEHRAGEEVFQNGDPAFDEVRIRDDGILLPYVRAVFL